MPDQTHAPGAVFLSYASQDAGAALRICEALRAAGVEVWFDQSELRGGDAWDQKIRRQIKECALFVPIISAATQARHEGYFRLEWHLAEQRSHLIARGRPFIVPVAIDQTTDAEALVPDAFLAVQWMRLPGGEVQAAFCDRVKKLLSPEQGAGTLPARPRSGDGEQGGQRTEPAAPLSVAKAERRRVWPWIVAAVIALPVLYLLFKPRRSPEEIAKLLSTVQAIAETAAAKSAAETKPAAATPAALSPARQLVERARPLIYGNNSLRADFDTATDLLEQASKLDPNDASIWAQWAVLDCAFLDNYFDHSAARKTLAQSHAARAMSLDPTSRDARYAKAATIVPVSEYSPSASAEAEKLLRPLIAENPDDAYALLGLAHDVANQGRTEEALALFDRAARLPGAAARAALGRSNMFYFAARFDEAERAAGASLASEQNWLALAWKTFLELTWQGDLDLAQRTEAGLSASWRLEPIGATNAQMVYAYRREPGKALEVLRAVPGDYLQCLSFIGPKALLIGDLLDMAGRTDAARIEWRSALQLVEQRLAATPNVQSLLELKVYLLARLGEREEATRLWQLDLGLYGDDRTSFMRRMIMIQLEPPDRVLEVLESMIKGQPLSWQVPTAAQLRLDPIYDPLRKEPRFQALLARAEADPRLSPKAMASAAAPNPLTQVPEPSSSPPVDAKSVAVLAFANLSDDKGNEYFSDGISEELLNVLAKIPGLKVTARTSSFHYKGKDTPIPEIARELGVAYVIEGSVRKAGDKVRITAQLIKAADGFHVWSDTFTRDLKDIFAVQDEIAGLIAQQLQLKLGDGPRVAKTVNPEAHQLYLQGKYFLNQFSVDSANRAVGLLQQAVELDPSFAPAWAALSRAGSVLGGYADTRQDAEKGMALARLAAERALALEPDLAAAHLALAEVQTGHDFDWQGAAGSLRRALALAPADAAVIDSAARLAYYFGQKAKSVELGAQAVALDPVNPSVRVDHGFALNSVRRFPEAEAEFRRLIELNPKAPWGHAGVSFNFTTQGRFDEAAAEAVQETNDWSRLYALTLAQWGQKKQSEADATLTQFIKADADIAAYQIAEIYAFRGDSDRAFEWLDRAYRQRDPGLAWSRSDIFLENLYPDPRWEKFMRKLGLADEQLK